MALSYQTNGLNQYREITSPGPATATLTYDINGNLISDGVTSYVYDIENRMVSASGNDHNGTLTYDPLGRLFQVTAPATGGGTTTTRFLYDGDALVAEYDGAGALTARYVHGSNPGADDPLVWYDGATRRYLFGDHQGSVIALSTGSTATPTVNTYDEYGIPGLGNTGRFQYTGQAWLPELGMYYYKARIYSPTLGRFMQTDPIGYADQINLYAYVGNDPVSHIDSSGRATVLVTFYDSFLGIKIGGHSGLYVSRSSLGPALFDPGGSYAARDAPGYAPSHPSGDMFTGYSANLRDYVRSGTSAGEYVRLTRINTTPAEEEVVVQSMTQGGASPFLCAATCSAVLRDLPSLRDAISAWTVAPDTLADSLAASPRRQSDTMIQPDGSSYEIPPPPPPPPPVTCIRTMGLGC